MRSRKPTTNVELEKLQRESFSYPLLETNPANFRDHLESPGQN